MCLLHSIWQEAPSFTHLLRLLDLSLHITEFLFTEEVLITVPTCRIVQWIVGFSFRTIDLFFVLWAHEHVIVFREVPWVKVEGFFDVLVLAMRVEYGF